MVLRNNEKIEIYNYKTKWKNINNQARYNVALAIKTKDSKQNNQQSI